MNVVLEKDNLSLEEGLKTLDSNLRQRDNMLNELPNTLAKTARLDSQDLEKLARSLGFFTELESKNFRLLQAETGNRDLMRAVDKEISSLQSQIAVKEATYQKSRGESSSVLEELKSALIKLTDLNREIGYHESEKVSNTLAVKLLKEKSIPELEAKLKDLEARKDELKDESELLEAKVNFLNRKIDELQSEILGLQESTKACEVMVKEKRIQLRQLATEKADLRSKQDQLEAHDEVLTKHLTPKSPESLYSPSA